MRFLLPVLSLMMLVAIVACGGDDESSADKSPGNINVPSETAEPSPGVLPETFPAEFPVYSEATLIRGDDFGGRFLVEWRIDDSTSDVVDFYHGALATAPWSIQTEVEESGVTQIEFTGAGQLRVSGAIAVAAVGNSSETRVLLSLLED